MVDPERKWTLPEKRNKLTKKQIVALFIAQDGKCCLCQFQELQVKGHMPIEFIDEHVNPLWRGGTNALSNRGLACIPCAGDKTSVEATERAKGRHVFERHIGVKKPKGRPMMGSRGSRYRKRMDGTVERRD